VGVDDIMAFDKWLVVSQVLRVVDWTSVPMIEVDGSNPLSSISLL
jgi:hypothetical protein